MNEMTDEKEKEHIANSQIFESFECMNEMIQNLTAK